MDQNQDSPQIPSSPPSSNTPPPGESAPVKPLGKAEKFKRVFFQVLIACLLGAAAIAVIAVLVGSFNDTLSRALGTIVVVALHAGLSFSYITETDKRDRQGGARSIELFSNTVFSLIILSFITAIFAIWQILDGGLTFRLYLLYGVLLFATLHADVLYRIRRFERKIDTIVSVNYLVMAAVVILLSIVIFSHDAASLSEFFYRILAAVGIIDATMTITAMIMHKLYLQKHPELTVKSEQAASARPRSFWQNPLVILLIIFLVFQVIGSLFALIVRGF